MFSHGPFLFTDTTRTLYFIASLQPICTTYGVKSVCIEGTSFCRININPCEVENCLKGHPAVLDCAVVSSPYMMTQVNHIDGDNLCGIFICANTVKTEKRQKEIRKKQRRQGLEV